MQVRGLLTFRIHRPADGCPRWLWGIALVFGSWNALVVALFQHAYIWVHMYCTETPDMRWVYGPKS